MKAIVLSGGGAKGAYQMGCWKALRKLNLKFDIVTGTSIGALNGMMMVQNNYYKTLRMWKRLSFNKLYENITDDLSDIQVYEKYIQSVIKEKGIKITKIEKLINKLYSPFLMKHSKKKFGVVVFNLKTLKHEYKIKGETNKLKDYVIASATCYPFFQKKRIDGIDYIDGGYYDNMPINLAIEMGATEVIAIDLKAIGIKQKIKDKSVKITYIEPTSKLESFLLFKKSSNKKMIKQGFNDTMKVFNKRDGKVFCFKKYDLQFNQDKYFKDFNRKLNSLCKIKMLNRFLTNVLTKDEFNEIVEYCGEIYNLDVTKTYRIKKYNKILLKKQSNSKNEIDKIINAIETNNLKILDFVINRKSLLAALYLLIIREV